MTKWPEPKRPTVAEAEHARICAEQNRRHALAIATADPEASYQWMRTAHEQEARAAAGLAVTETPVIGIGGDLVAAEDQSWPAMLLRRGDVNAVQTQAALERLRMAGNAGSFALGADVAESVRAKDPIERMLADQFAAMHKHGMDYLARAMEEPNTIERCRLANTAARLFSVSQEAVMTVVRKRSGGKQTVLVQHVTVKEGAQALIGSVQAGASERPRGVTKENG